MATHDEVYGAVKAACEAANRKDLIPSFTQNPEVASRGRLSFPDGRNEMLYDLEVDTPESVVAHPWLQKLLGV